MSRNTALHRACLTENDLQGLLYSYPVCNDALIHRTESICVKSERNIGWVRFLTAIIPPCVVASLGVFILVRAAIFFENRRQSNMRKMVWRDAAARALALEREGSLNTNIGAAAQRQAPNFPQELKVFIRRKSGAPPPAGPQGQGKPPKGAKVAPPGVRPKPPTSQGAALSRDRHGR